MRSILRRPTLWLLVVILLGAGAYAIVRARGPQVRVAQAARKDIEQHIVASGRVWVPTRVQVSAQTPGLVRAVNVREGNNVKVGDLLLQLDDAEARADVAQAEASVQQASAHTDQLRKVGAIVANEGLNQAQSNLERAEADFARTQKLVAASALAPADLDNARWALDVARAQKTAAEAQQVSSGPAGSDTRIALTALFQAQSQLAGANARLAQTKIFALTTGVVLTRSVEPGDVVQPSRTLLVIAAGDDTELVFQADERNLATLAVGQSARASADAYPTEVFDSVVSYIAPSIDPQRGSIEVRLKVQKPPAFLKPDMTVSLDITVATKTDTLVVSSDVVRAAASPAPWVFVVEGGRVSRREVKLGLRGEGSTEVTSGLDDGALVVVPDGQKLAAGQRVRSTREEP